MVTGIVRSISVGVVASLVLVLVACGSGFDFKGTWKGNRNIPPLPGERPGVAYTLGQVTLKIDSVGFKLTEAGIPYEGTVRYADGKAFLRIETRIGVAIAKEPKEVQDQYKSEVVLTPRPDGGIDFYDPSGFFEKPVALQRSPE